MKAITIQQPWTSLLAHRVKKYETRSWATAYRGPIAIHASAAKVPQVLNKFFPEEQDRLMFFDAVSKGLHGCYTEKEIESILNGLPTGSVIATANLVGCHKINAIHGNQPRCFGNEPFIGLENGLTYTADDVEVVLGDWTPGRYAWEFSDMKIITPIQAKGKLGLWNWDGGGLDV